MGYTEMKQSLEFNHDEEDRGRIALNSWDAYCALQLLIDKIQDGDYLSLSDVKKDLRELAQDWHDL